MKIENVMVHNWEPPGGPWWDARAREPDEPDSIKATLEVTLSYREYQELLDRDKEAGRAADQPLTVHDIIRREG